MSLQHGQRVQWREGRVTATGSIVCENKYWDGSNPHYFYTVKVDDAFYLIACRTASEMNLHWVNRSVTLDDLRPLT